MTRGHMIPIPATPAEQVEYDQARNPGEASKQPPVRPPSITGRHTAEPPKE